TSPSTNPGPARLDAMMSAAVADVAATLARPRAMNERRGQSAPNAMNHPASSSAQPRSTYQSGSVRLPLNTNHNNSAAPTTSGGRRGGSATSRSASGTRIRSVGCSDQRNAVASASAAAAPQPCSPCPASVRVASDIRDQRQIPRPLDRGRDLPLVPRAHARHAAREHLALFRDQAAERLLVLVVDLA